MKLITSTQFIILFVFIISTQGTNLSEENEEYLRFPPNFLLGAATAAYQIEGAWNVSDKGESVWDRFSHERNGRIVNNDTGDIACDSYHKFREDVSLMKQLGIKAYRFSLSWPRILPTGFSNKVSKDGIAYYHNLIDELLANDIEPIVTLYHWDHPQVIEDAGGWLNPYVIDCCIFIYTTGIHAPSKSFLHGIGEYICAENMLKAHARVYRMYQKEFKDIYNGSLGWLLHPIFSEKGDYPDIMKKLIAIKSQEQGYPRSRLPELGANWVDYIRGTSDFLSVNHYTSTIVERGDDKLEPSFYNDQGLIHEQDPTWESTVSSWLKIVPEGFGNILRKLAIEYNNPLIYITENGVSDENTLDDDKRVTYYQKYLKEMLVSIHRDKVNIKGYTLWSLIDSFEWSSGYSQTFGIVHVNFTDPERKRTLKKSAHWWREVIKYGSLKIRSLENGNSTLGISILKQTEALTNVEFPDGFQLGVATASYQIEGAWNTNGKGVNTWDIFTHNGGGVIRDNSNGDVACDSYHRYKEDVQLISDIGADFYRFSLSWSRILPNGFSNVINQDGLNYYKNLIDELLAKGIQPHVSIFHWDLPENMEKLGGWTNELIIDYFVDYARIVFRELGPKVKLFYTLNEPAVFCGEGYGLHTKAPGKNITGIGSYLCMHNALKAHAKVYHMYDEEFRSEQKGLISIVISSSAYFAKNENNLAAEDIAFQFICGWVGHPIYSKTGDYPQVMKNRIAENSRIQGYSKSRLPEFTPEWIEYIRGTSDFFALNHYTSNLVEIVPKGPNDTWYRDSGIKFSYDPKWPSSGSSWLKIVPEGFRKILNAIKNEYNNPPVIITENGVSDDGKLSDKIRINYFSEYLKAMLQAIYEDGCNIKGYTVWSLIDNFEWENGYIEKFGLVQIDFASPNKTRTPKMSMEWYKNVIKQRKITNFAPNTNEYDVVSVR
uniref:beta-glucosidase n=1 Tax=Vespula pensylvanica TaxID=30213 RepID=A0A834U8W9_VESPE|nr:hypothetical protein H0235_009906 [Vespula pensylvanica]